MARNLTLIVLAVSAVTAIAIAQTTNDPFPSPIAADEGVIAVRFTEFATIPDVGMQAPRVMQFLHEAGTRKYFVSVMTGLLYSVSLDGRAVSLYLDLNVPDWQVPVQSQNSERGFHSFAFHPQFNQRGAGGFGKFYTVVDTTNVTPPGDFKNAGGTRTHDTVLLEWTARNPEAAAYDGGPPRELIRFEQPFANHNAGHTTFNPYATPQSPDYGLLYIGFADGGSGGDPTNMAQNLGFAFGKILRIDPLGNNSANGKYGIPPDNPYVKDSDPNTLGEIYAYGLRNPQRLFWDSRNGNMFISDIGQNTIEEISPVTAGANLGWNVWEGSFRFVPGRGGGVNMSEPRSDPKVMYPVAEYGQVDPLLQNSSAAIGGFVYRNNAIPQLSNLLIFGDNPSGEIFYVNADKLPPGGQDAIRRVLLDDNGVSKTLLQVVREKNASQGRMPANRVDLRFGEGPDGSVFLLNKRDGVIRRLESGR